MICRSCLMPSTRPRVVFTDGECNACIHARERKMIDWDSRFQEFREVMGAHKKHAAYDCIVAFSGGKDSASIAWRLKHEFGYNPLLVCYGQLLWTDVGRRNLHRIADAGFDIFYWRHNQQVSRKLARRFFVERGHPKQHYDAGVNTIPLRAAVSFGIPLVFYAEHGESFYGGLVRNEEARRTRDLAEVLENQVGDDPLNWTADGITEADLFTYAYPRPEELTRVGVKAFYWSYFFPWDIYANAKLMREKVNFEPAQNFPEEWLKRDFDFWVTNTPQQSTMRAWNYCYWGKSDGTFEGFDSIDDMIDDLDFYMMYIKFGFGRATRMASRLIQSGHMTREQGLELVRRYDGEFPRSYLTQVLDYLGMTEPELIEIVDKHRNPEIWKLEGNEWKLKEPPV